ncbi:Protein/nucleic acid deglycase HchA [Candidatus Lokiarchaeum ossiferum]|uniref:Protein/nucleic acid deglycase HchA n=1 Tax=Candidatus Lokiarchaeum ossiferum TaxID=2951803 RepID=A0ABY6HLY1_9ARCH|nr:Protein/nucleic acid deglycase HchA [Candidatus Lokiarchaeum sp. B-35]
MMTKRKRTALIVCAIFLVVLSTTTILLPSILRGMGLHPHFEGDEIFDMSGKKALVITTSHDTLDATGEATGVFASEMTVPYYSFLDAGMSVDVASIQGGEIPVEPVSTKWPLRTEQDKRFLNDADLLDKVENSLIIDNINFSEYDVVYMAGGWGAAYDLGQSAILGQKITEAYASGVILGSVCHGALGFLQANDTEGNPLVEGRTMTAVTDKQIEELGISHTPLHPETALREAGANFVSATAFRDMFASWVAIDESNQIVTGQNQNDGAETAYEMMKLVYYGS